MSDIVKRLRTEQECGNCCGSFSGGEMLGEAADEIERLRALIERSGEQEAESRFVQSYFDIDDEGRIVQRGVRTAEPFR